MATVEDIRVLLQAADFGETLTEKLIRVPEGTEWLESYLDDSGDSNEPRTLAFEYVLSCSEKFSTDMVLDAFGAWLGCFDGNPGDLTEGDLFVATGYLWSEVCQGWKEALGKMLANGEKVEGTPRERLIGVFLKHCPAPRSVAQYTKDMPWPLRNKIYGIYMWSREENRRREEGE